MILGGSVRLIFLRTSTPPGFVCLGSADFALVPPCWPCYEYLNLDSIPSTVLSRLKMVEGGLIFTASHGQSLVVCNDFSYLKAKLCCCQG